VCGLSSSAIIEEVRGLPCVFRQRSGKTVFGVFNGAVYQGGTDIIFFLDQPRTAIRKPRQKNQRLTKRPDMHSTAIVLTEISVSGSGGDLLFTGRQGELFVGPGAL
jgi:hypothetical protein